MPIYNLDERKMLFNHFKQMSRSELVKLLLEQLDQEQVEDLLKHLKEAKQNEKQKLKGAIDPELVDDLHKP